MILIQLFFIVLAGGCGAVVRAWLDSLITTHTRAKWPVGIFTVNVLGCFCIGALIGFAFLPFFKEIYPVITLGFLGGFTTFSTAMTDVVHLAQQKRYVASFALLTGTYISAFIALYIGLWLPTLIFFSLMYSLI
ncbi:CrcB family protein [Actinotignum urinale]|uniref:fluoride efflux transporter FluC n=1 Tax=Actinotignum urinale TaxID=190146 RepID=UPI002A803269|nr:CrcB family protein [Actinotignum urinale]MDY5128516.1 CrcB family protein [Actinotignum urinale]